MFLKGFCLLWVALAFPLSLSAQQAYFQQDVKYEIHVQLDDQNHFLHASWKLEYTNNSPDTLKEMFMHLWPNAYSSSETAFGKQKVEEGSLAFYNAPDHKRGYIDSLEFKCDGKPVWHNAVGDDPDIIRLSLPDPIVPGATVVFTSPFRVKIPLSYSRLGRVGRQYQITQWYPKPAVYDKDGWHPMPYLDQGEFYSEFGSFDVFITLPANYVVGATGDLPQGSPEYDFLARRELLTRSLLGQDSVNPIIEPDYADSEKKVLHFHQEKVHDFAWFCDKNYHVLTKNVTLPESGREVRCVSMFTASNFKNWEDSDLYVARSVRDYSLWVGDYPYNHATAVDGALSAGAGMEYPNITVVGGRGGARALDNVIAHEVGHNWFYGILGSNERDHAWMDEGCNSFMEGRYMNKHYKGESGMLGENGAALLGIENTDRASGQLLYDFSARSGLDQPIDYPSGDYTGINYGTMVYMKTALALSYLEAYLGKEVTDQCFHTYYQEWKFKHPQPEDMQRVFERVSGKQLGWFFEGVIKEKNYIDFKLGAVKDGQITVINRSGMPLPAPVSLLNKEGEVIKTIWTAPFEGETVVRTAGQEFHAVQVYRDNFIPDQRPTNNEKNAKGLFKGGNPLSLHLGYKYPRATKSDVNVLPALGGNTFDGFLLGALVHKGYFPGDRFRFHLMPMYGFRSGRLTGSASGALRWLPKQAFRKVELRVAGSSFSNIIRSKQSLVLYPKVADIRRGGRQRIALESHILGSRPAEGDISPSDWLTPVFARATWEMRNGSRFYDSHIRTEVGSNFTEKAYRASASLYYKRFYDAKKKYYARGRAFVAGMTSSGSGPNLLRYGLSGSGDPFGEQALFDRAGNGGLFGRQLVNDHGGFSSRIDESFDRFLGSFSGAVNTPLKLEVFGEIAYGKSEGEPGESFYGAGIRLPLLKDAVRINLPLLGSVYGGFVNDFSTFGDNITFTFEPFKLAESLGWKLFDFR